MAGREINLFKGYASPRLLPRLEILEASSRILRPEKRTYDEDPENKHPLLYGTDIGALWVREEIAQWSNSIFFADEKHSRARARADSINLTGGASYGICNILLQCTLPHNSFTRQAFIVTPTYYLINSSFVDAGFKGKLTGVEEDDNGNYDLEALESKIRELESSFENSNIDDSSIQGGANRPFKKVYKYVFYCVPEYSNPTGKSLSTESRVKLVELARKYDMLVICDDVYDLLNYQKGVKTYKKRMVYLDRETQKDPESYGNVISNASFSKIIGPGLRIGWQESINDKLAIILSQGGANKSGGTPGQFNTYIAGELIKSGKINTIIDGLNKVYSERAEVVKKCCKKYLPEGTTFSGASGGYFIWVTTPDHIDCRKVVEKAKESGLILAGGDDFEVSGDVKGWGRNSVRVAVSYMEKEDIIRGFQIWGETIQSLQ
ncbi:2-aminoadipate transaminase [Ascoidea rubescens DSM 1968]|uniref:PLP-dependent transferase n=1 Tax=Ascoidea rubescens DSM 1968 TaxID=1344418 RepID=A0A1D2VJZ7_9ASCO|nr:PLP-dependent transferase [Ascoidea rubescens DSM 1968]ODV61926.1 PLP-dependent transferase [Ascoidea rubescens DSM 1968]